MVEWLIYLAFVLVAVLIVFNGFLMLFTPTQHRKFLDRLSQAERWSLPNTRWKPGLQVQYRSAGLALAVMAAIMIYQATHWIQIAPSSQPSAWESPAGIRPDWHALVVAFVLGTAGLYLFVVPRSLARFVARAVPHRWIRDSAFDKWGRIMGVAMFVGSVFAFLAWLRSR
jgi:hypothetical protein